MCGICGFDPADFNQTPDREAIVKMCAPLINRGPDEAGLHIAPGIGLGHRRLKVIDQESGRQPMSDPSGRYTLVFNGEIYNYLELKRELAASGYVFSSKSDTEVLLCGLIHSGLAFLDKTNGMFAFGLWDNQERELLLARDRFGVKPLYWTLLPHGGLAFASEASALTASDLFSPVVNQKSLACYLALSYIPGPASIFTGINRLAPGSWLRYSAVAGVKQGQWWNMAEAWEEGRAAAGHITDWEEEFLELLSDAVKIRMKSDVPLGAFLSSGLDSSTVVALMKTHSSNVSAFTMSFSERSHNEAPPGGGNCRTFRS